MAKGKMTSAGRVLCPQCGCDTQGPFEDDMFECLECGLQFVPKPDIYLDPNEYEVENIDLLDCDPQDQLRATRQILLLYLKDHERLPRDAWPKRPGDPRDYYCGCTTCEQARALMRDERSDDYFDPVQRQEIDLADESYRADLMGFNDDPPDPPEPGEDYYDR